MAATDNTKFLNKTQYEVAMQRLAQVTGRSLAADANNAFKADLSSSDRVLGSWTHPTATATTIAAANTKVLSAITVDAYGHVTSVSSKTLALADLPTITVAKGGTGLTTWSSAYRIIYSTNTTAVTTLAPNTTTTKKFLSMTGTGSAGKAPEWSALSADDIPNLAWSKITSGKPTTLSGYGITDAKIEAVTGGDKITLGSNNITVADWAQGTGTKIASSALPSLYIGTTAVSATSGTVTSLTGVTTFYPSSSSPSYGFAYSNGSWNFSSDLGVQGDIEAQGDIYTDSDLVVGGYIYLGSSSNPYLYWDSTNNAWHLTGNFVADGYVSAGGVSSTGGGGGGGSDLYVVTSWSALDTSDSGQVLGSVLGQDINSRLAALETSSTNVSFTQTLTSGKQVGTITIDGTSTNLYAPASYAWSEITGTGNVLTASAAKGSTTKPIYVSAAGTIAECSTYAGGTKVTLNGANKGASTASFYAPTGGGTSGNILKSNGSSAPTWDSVSNIMSAYATTEAMNTAIANAIDGVTSFEYSIVTTLPTTGVKGTIYLISHTHGTQDVYDEYIWVGDAYEKIGNTDIDLSGYWSTSDLVAITATENTTLLNTYFPVS